MSVAPPITQPCFCGATDYKTDTIGVGDLVCRQCERAWIRIEGAWVMDNPLGVIDSGAHLVDRRIVLDVAPKFVEFVPFKTKVGL